MHRVHWLNMFRQAMAYISGRTGNITCRFIEINKANGSRLKSSKPNRLHPRSL